ncbi:MAG: hypothetical protein KDA83_04720 [Planctomycetales bacterium]|nr:hypothetical protein [Planctomycetales bacterium]
MFQPSHQPTHRPVARMSSRVAGLLLLVAIVMGGGHAAAQDEPGDSEPPAGIELIIVGKLETGIVAIGGETTGTVVRASGVTWEVEWEAEREEALSTFAERISGNQVAVSGSLRLVKGVERGDRWILTAHSLAAAPAGVAPARGIVQARIQGRLNNQVVAIGGETTGTVVDAGDFSWELELGRDLDLRKAAEALDGQSVTVEGNIEVAIRTVERGRRPIVGVGRLIASAPAESIPAVSGVIIVPENTAAFADRTLEVRLFEFDPLLADVGATEIDVWEMANFEHMGADSEQLAFELGKGFQPRLDRSYYITVFSLHDGVRTQIGELDGQAGLAKVLQGTFSSRVTMILRELR